MNWSDYLNSLKSLINNTIKIFILFSVISIQVSAQQDSTIVADSTKSKEIFEMQKSPWGAVLRSAVMPGLGQIYNASYWKVPVIWGITGWLVYNWVDNNSLYKDNRDIFAETANDFFRKRRDFYRDQRDNFAIYIVLTYFLNLVDAYVDAHLFDFSVKEDFISGQKMFNVRMNF
jgi:hypothetical protein